MVASAASTISTVAAAELSSGRKRDDGAAAVKNVADELERGRVHQAVRIDAQRDVVNGFAAMNRFGDHQLLVFGPSEVRARLLAPDLSLSG